MVSAERITVTLQGGAPWGFRMSGGGSLPLTINKIRKKSAAHTSGLKEGDAVLSINGIPVYDKSQDGALELVERAGETLTLEIFRGDTDDLSRDKPKKTIQIGGGGRGRMEGLIVTATVDDTAAPEVQPQASVDASSDLILTVDNVTSESFETAESGFTATVGDVSESAFESSGSGFTMTASADDVTSSPIMVDSITAELGDVVSSGVDVQAQSAVSPNLAQPFIDSNVIAVSPSHLSPQPPRGSLSPKPVSFSPKPKAPSPRSPIPPVASPKSPAFTAVSPKSPSFIATSPKPVTVSPGPGLVQPIVQNTSPKPFKPVSPPTGPQPSAVSSSTTVSTETFDDGQGQIQREVVVTAQKANDGATVIKRQSTTVSTSTKKGPSFIKHKASAFEAPTPTINKGKPQVSNTTAPKPTPTNNFNSNGPVPFSAPPAPPIDSVFNAPPTVVSSPLNLGKQTPIFKPSKFVLGQSKQRKTDGIPLNYPTASQSADVTVKSMYKDGKENVQPPMFQVKNHLADKGKKRKDIWKPNIWTGQLHQQKQQQQPDINVRDDFSPYSTFPVPPLQSGVSLLDNRNKQDKIHRYESYEEYDEVDNNGQALRPNRLHIFAPPVEMHAPEDSGYPDSPYSPYLPYREDGEIDVGYNYDDGPSSPDSSVIRRRRNLYSDSAFYDTPGKSYPTINEQMKLCKIIATSLTSQANRRARGAKMFMKRKRKSSKWVHDGHSEWSSSAGDVANILDLESELTVDEGGTKPLFYFKIPNLKNRISSADRKMALTQEQFERLRLQSHKCDHKVVPPNTCFNIVADLKSSKGRGGRMFEKRKVRVEKYVVDDKNARHARPRQRLETALSTPVKQEKTPWEAAIAHDGNVDAAFSHIDEMDRNQKLQELLRYPQPKKAPSTPLPKSAYRGDAIFNTSLKSDSTMMLVRGKNFNRTARGWGGGGEYPLAENILSIPPPVKKPISPARPVNPQSVHSPSYGNYNPKIKAWQAPGNSPYVTTSSAKVQGPPSALSPSRRQDGWGQQSWHAEVQRPQAPQPEVRRSHDDIHVRPKSWVSDSYDVNPYKEEYDYTYVPVDYKFSDDYPSPAYKQPIIPGTDL